MIYLALDNYAANISIMHLNTSAGGERCNKQTNNVVATTFEDKNTLHIFPI